MTLIKTHLIKGTLERQTIKALVAAMALLMLTGAKGEGCGGGEEPPPPPEECEPGFHLEVVCEDYCALDSAAPGSIGDQEDCGGACDEICVPDDNCPEGTVEELICDPMPLSDGQLCVDGEGGLDCTPPEPDCYVACVPVDPCGPGFREETVCVTYESDPNMPEPPPVEECWTECVPDFDCPPGQHPEEVCAYCEESICEIICIDDYPTEPSEPQAS